jgi:four helix bundle protein
MQITNFKDLEVWKEALYITKEIYDVTSQTKFSKDYGLRDQIQRAVVSISSNIVEGFEKNNNNEFSRYLRIAKGSAGEVRNQLEIAHIIGYISSKQLQELDDKLVLLAKRIGSLLSYLQNIRKGAKIQK